MAQRRIPFNFILDLLPRDITVKPMFGMYAIYTDNKIVLMLRERSVQPELNGIWIATNTAHHQSLEKELGSLLPVSAGVRDKTEWQLLQAEAKNFEQATVKVCELISRGDARIGRVPVIKKK